MLDIHVPLWLVLTISGLPTLFLLGLVARIMRIKHRKSDLQDSPEPFEFEDRSTTFGGHIHRELLEQHIDAVFASLSTIIDAERIKLKTLARHSGMPLWTDQPQPANKQSDEGKLAPDESSPAEMSLGQRIAALTEQGLPVEQVAARLGLSRAEVALALKMKTGRRPFIGSKVHAVA